MQGLLGKLHRQRALGLRTLQAGDGAYTTPPSRFRHTCYERGAARAGSVHAPRLAHGFAACE